MTTLPTIDAQNWASRIAACWQQSVAAVLETGRLISEAKAALEHGEFTRLIDEGLPFTARTAQRLMAISADERLSKPTRVSLLPPHWGTLYDLTRLDDDALDARFADGTISPDMERRDVAAVLKQQVRERREVTLAAAQAALPEKRYGVIYADPEWRFEVYSRDTGMDRSADNHYPTSATDAIMKRPVSDIAAEDSVLFLWATVPMIQDALDVMQAWGFEYKSHCIWTKDKVGTGYWFRNAHELLLVGTRGKVPAPAMGTQWPSTIEARVGKHSAKPERFYELIEEYFPNLPKIELNARDARAGWDSWGNEAPAESCDAATGEILTAGEASTEPVSHRPLQPVTQNNPADDPLYDVSAFLRRHPVSPVVVSPRSSQSENAGETG